ncbi:related to proline iminopeptidase [Lecanosticta acicola]|uniref:Related to proline iminopeptidase n=1 Tax=Lecanosticta acicola TaxID=111012 RepID=A0AAI8YZD5_9PEZI|nr:related to proline iminopeptidase [Lecanosticta acicola]
MAKDNFRDGKAPFNLKSRHTPCETYYKIYGDLDCGRPPLIVLHGGPGVGHAYLEAYSGIATDCGIPVVFYDQIGCALSTHLPETNGDKAFWQPSLFVEELESLLAHLNISREDGPGFHVFGHSWGGTLAATFASRQPPGLRKLIIVSGTSDGQIFQNHLWQLLKQLPEAHEKAVEDAIRREDLTDPAYLAAMAAFGKAFLCRSDPWPPAELIESRKNQAADPTVRDTMQGRSPFLYDGSMEHYSTIPLLPKINVPTLLFNGEFDTAGYPVMVQFFNHIPKVKWMTLDGASHMSHLDSEAMRERTLKLVGEFLKDSQ